MDKMENDLKPEEMIPGYLRRVFGLINRVPFDKINMIMVGIFRRRNNDGK